MLMCLLIEHLRDLGLADLLVATSLDDSLLDGRLDSLGAGDSGLLGHLLGRLDLSLQFLLLKFFFFLNFLHLANGLLS